MTFRNNSAFPILTTERLTLRQLCMDDQQNIFLLRSDSEINQYLDRTPAKTIEDAANFINAVTKSIQTNSSLYWVISITNTNSFAGTICLFDFSDDANSCEIGYELTVKCQGQGIMKEAAEKVIDYAFRDLQFQKITAATHPKNTASSRLLTKLGFLKTKREEMQSSNLDIFTLTQSNRPN